MKNKRLIIYVVGYHIPIIPCITSSVEVMKEQFETKPTKRIEEFTIDALYTKEEELPHDNIHPFSKFIGKKKY